jgi:hypothetical protein
MEFMALPEEMEKLLEQQLDSFMGTTTKPYLPVSERTKRFTERMYAAAHEGKLPSEMIEEERRRAEEEAAIRIEEERRRAEEETVVRLHIQLLMPIEHVALAMDISPQAVEEILHRYGHQ